MTHTNTARMIAERIEQVRPAVKSGALRFFGDWFGGRPFENIHVVVHAEAQENYLIVTFNQAERLTVWSPGGHKIDRKTFRISSASRVLWQWYLYDCPQTPENLHQIDYRAAGFRIRVETDFAPSRPDLRPSRLAPAVEIC